MSLDFKIKRALRGLSYPEAAWNPVWLGALEPSELQELFHQPVRYEELYEEAISAWDKIDRRQSDRQDAGVLHAVLPAGRHLDQGRPRFDDGFAGSARAVSRQRRRGVRAQNSASVQVPQRANQVPAEEGAGRRAAEGHHLSEEERASASLWRDGLKGLARAANRAACTPKPDAAWVERENGRSIAPGKADHRLFLWCWIVLQSHLGQGAS